MESQDVTITCQDCGQSFVFTAGEQTYYKERGFLTPKRCKNCRGQRKREKSTWSSAPRRPTKDLHDAVCTACGAPTQVPFKPLPGRAVYCRQCLSSQRSQRP